MKTKYPLLLAAFALSVSPSLAQDLLYLKCDETRAFRSISTYDDGEQFTLEKNVEDTVVLRIDTRNEQMLINGSEADIEIKNNEAIYSGTFDNGRIKDAKVIHTKLIPPYSRHGKGKVVVKEPFSQIINVIIRADCIKIDSAEFVQMINSMR